MALRYPITSYGTEYEALLTLPGTPGVEPVVIPGYDLEADLAAAALGLDPTPAVRLYAEWTSPLSRFLASTDNLENFLTQVHKQGLEAVGLTKKTLGTTLSSTLHLLWDDDEEVRDKIDRDDFWYIVKENYPTYGNLEWDQVTIWDAAEEADNAGLPDVFAMLEGISKEALYEYIIEPPYIKETDDTSVEVEMDVVIKILGDEKQRFMIRGSKAFRDAELEDFEWEVDLAYSQEPDTYLAEILDELGEETDPEQLLRDHADIYVEEPYDVPHGDGEGDYAVFMDNQFHDRFLDYGYGERFVDLAREVVDREGLGTDVRLYELRDDVDPDDFEETDIDNWEEIA